jgi:hypothetical protein
LQDPTTANPSNRTASPFSTINDPDKQHATLGATTHRTDSWSLSPPLSGEGVVTLQHATRSAQISKKLSCLVIRRLETSGTLHLIRLYYALYPAITKERFTQNIIQHRNLARRRRGWDSRKGRKGQVEVLSGDWRYKDTRWIAEAATNEPGISYKTQAKHF